MVVRKIIKPLFHRTRRLLAKRYLRLMSARQIAVTGSMGKTNTTYVLSKMLPALGKVEKTDINLDTIYNVPITALKVRPWHKFVIFELGVDHIGEMDKHLEIARPQVSVITGISPVHTDEEHFGSLQKLIEEKRKMIQTLAPSGFA
ncbi:MAG TPA: Mur ligase family protein, partial [Candidatus Nitrosocosmicus sp.]|nr:Mur ligase family protein [Candidatus Nitrosocosmicus sp.]